MTLVIYTCTSHCAHNHAGQLQGQFKNLLPFQYLIIIRGTSLYLKLSTARTRCLCVCVCVCGWVGGWEGGWCVLKPHLRQHLSCYGLLVHCTCIYCTLYMCVLYTRCATVHDTLTAIISDKVGVNSRVQHLLNLLDRALHDTLNKLAVICLLQNSVRK